MVKRSNSVWAVSASQSSMRVSAASATMPVVSAAASAAMPVVSAAMPAVAPAASAVVPAAIRNNPRAS